MIIKNKIFVSALIGSFLFFPFSLQAQKLIDQVIVKESEVKIQEKFIEAQQEKLLGRYEKAFQLLEEVYLLNRDNSAVSFDLSKVAIALNRKEDALNYAEQAVKLEPNNIWYGLNLLDIYDEYSKTNEAALLCTNLIKTNKQNYELYYRQSFYFAKANKLTEALASLDELEKKIGLDPEIVRQKHELYLAKNDAKKATNELQRLVNANPKNAEYLHWLAEYYEKTGDKANALLTYQRITSVDPSDTKAALIVAQSGVAQNLTTSNEQFDNLNKIFANKGGDLDAKIARLLPFINEIESKKKDVTFVDNIIKLSQTLVETHPTQAKAFAMHGDVLYFAEKTDLALNAYQKASELDASVYSVWEQQLQILAQKKDYKKLLSTAQNTIDNFPNQVMPYLQSGFANIQLGKFSTAIPDLEQAQLMSIRNPNTQQDVLGLLALAYNNNNQFDKAIETYEKGLKMNPKAYNLMNSYAFTLARRKKNMAKANELVTTALSGDSNNPSIHATKALISFLENDLKTCKSYLEQSIKNGGEALPSVLELQGDVFFSEGNTEKAIASWSKSLESNPNNQVLKQKIASKKLIDY